MKRNVKLTLVEGTTWAVRDRETNRLHGWISGTTEYGRTFIVRSTGEASEPSAVSRDTIIGALIAADRKAAAR